MENKEETKPIRNWHPFEYAHVVLWLIKDMCWAQGWIKLGTVMVFPTVLVAIIITWIQRKDEITLVHNAAVSIWISANSLWMLAEFYHLEPILKPWSSVGFGAGLLLLGLYYGKLLFGRKNSA
jgi:hypothetical protein